ncbi:hypothetical protein CRM22_005887 [Opisthorchis felineus]|uniref:EF-hand domain-containing protein n=1 Tax=Opisthorchis felineus TaxID=147828 RepID=A0A4V3SEP9_OPIFE|nr:hypothetical protein CRM22_005887 [Opisthorchis felineus]
MENMKSFFATLSGTPKKKATGKPVGNNAQSTGTAAVVADQETLQKALTGSSQSKKPGTRRSSITRVQFDVPEEEVRPPEKQSSLRNRARTTQDRNKPKQESEVKAYLARTLNQPHQFSTLYPSPARPGNATRPAREVTKDESDGLSLDESPIQPRLSETNPSGVREKPIYPDVPTKQDQISTVQKSLEGQIQSRTTEALSAEHIDFRDGHPNESHPADRPGVDHLPRVVQSNRPTSLRSTAMNSSASSSPGVKESEATTDTLRVPKLVLIAPCGDHTQLSESTNGETSSVVTQKALETTSPKEAIGGFTYLDPQNTGFVDAQSVTGYWTKLGIPDPETVLKKLGFPCQGQLDLKKLTEELESYMAINDSTDTIAVAAMLTLLNEWRLARSTITTLMEEKAHLYDEAERLKLSLNASQQAETIALERKYKHDLETNREQSLAEQNALREHFAQQMETMRRALGKVITDKSHLEEALDQEKRKTEDLCSKLSASQTQLKEMESRTTGNEMKMFQLNRQNEKLEDDLKNMSMFKVEYERFNKLKEQLERASENALLLNTQDNQLTSLKDLLQVERNHRCFLEAINKKLLVEKQQLEEKFKERENRMVEQQKGSATKDLELRESQNLNKQLMKIIGSLEKNLELQNKEIYVHQENSVHLRAELLKIKLENENLEKQTNQLQSQCRQLEYELNQRSDLTEIGVATRSPDSNIKSPNDPSMETKLLADQLKQTLVERRCLLEYQSDLETTLKIQAKQLETLQRGLENQEHETKGTRSKEQASDNRYKAPLSLQSTFSVETDASNQHPIAKTRKTIGAKDG